MRDRSLCELLGSQCGVVGRSQLFRLGLTDNDIRRMLRRRELARLHDGVYLDHTGHPTWTQRAWGAVLWAAPAALCRESAKRAALGSGRLVVDDGLAIHVLVDHSRFLKPPRGIVVHRTARIGPQVLWNTSPPRQRIEEAALDLAAGAERDVDAVAHVADVVGARLTTGARMATALAARARVARRRFLESLITDVGAGTCSTLEHGYLVLVERPHGLPTATRQFRDSAKGPIYRDAVYERFTTYVELDGRLFHARTRDRDRDLERDLDAAVAQAVTARLGYGQVFDRPCTTAFKIGAILADRGWQGAPRRCRRCPAELPRSA